MSVRTRNDDINGMWDYPERVHPLRDVLCDGEEIEEKGEQVSQGELLLTLVSMSNVCYEATRFNNSLERCVVA